MAKIVCVGSVNADIYVEIDRLPVEGETLSAKEDSGFMLPGGKGANQAVATSKLGANTFFVGMFGNDSHAQVLKHVLEEHKVNISQCQDVNKPSGQAFILLQAGGENSIIIVAGANNSWPEELDAAVLETIRGASLVLLQREIPDRVNLQVARIAKEAGVTVMMDVGGRAEALPAEFLPHISILSPNETELARITGMSTASDQEVEAACQALLSQGVQAILVKLGSRGSLYVSSQEVIRQAAIPAPCVIDTTGAGDCFTAAFAVALSSGQGVSDSMRFASAAATLCIQKKGAIPSMPERDAVISLLQ
eukprot:TRINITY_DN12488_c0_g1_i1.p1 TRINITY_DN12488_c0_g1~~TRINITY_DN12488_c0_g1_i1.p1  ORF type:complete len:307 (+),score=102.17 TRINITY_DN12488_c0_g1_i1:56-976(+)